MFGSQRLHSLLDVASSRKDRRRPARRSRNAVRLLLESLEERLTPSGGNPTVTQTAGSYAGLAAVAADTAANTNYVIDITNSFTFAAGKQVAISGLGANSTLKIEGQGGTNYALTGNGNRLFDVDGAGQAVTLANLTLTGGSGVTTGGAIQDQGGSVTLSGVTVTANTATGTATDFAQGGGVFVSDGGSLSINNSTIANNVAQGRNGDSASPSGGLAEGGGVFFRDASTMQISDSMLSNNTAQGGAGFSPTTPGSNGGGGSEALGGCLYVSGSGWTVTLTGNTLSGNAAIGGNGGNGATGANGGFGLEVMGGGLYAFDEGNLTIRNDLTAPLTHPSIMIGNTATGGTGGDPGGGGIAGAGGNALGGALVLISDYEPLTANIANTTFYGNAANGGDVGASGAPPLSTPGGRAMGGGLFFNLHYGSVTMVNSTVAVNEAQAGSSWQFVPSAFGGGISDVGLSAGTFENNTITQNAANSSYSGLGGGLFAGQNPTLINNLIQGNSSSSSAADLYSPPLTNATNNFIQFTNPNAIDTATNIVGNSTPQLGPVMGVDSGGHPTGGTIYYPLLPIAVSIGAGTTSVLTTLSGVEGNTQPTDEIGAHRTTNGSISLGAVQPLVPDRTGVVPGNARVNYYGASAAPALQIAAVVNDV
jgi:hypothetical protein